MTKEEKAAYMKKYWAEHRVEHRDSHRRWKRTHPESRKKKRQRNKASDPVKHKARVMAANAVKRGKLVRSPFCQLCLGTERSEGHHPDYAKPLEVVWLCPPCHRAIHGNAA